MSWMSMKNRMRKKRRKVKSMKANKNKMVENKRK